MSQVLYTIGYEGALIEPFIATLVHCGIEQVLDVRDVAVSRKPGFSKSALQSALNARDISYYHLRPLGDPKAGCDAMRSGDRRSFMQIYSDHLQTRLAQDALGEAVDRALSHISVLLCFERSPVDCHRKIAASEMTAVADFELRNVGVNALPQPRNPYSVPSEKSARLGL